MGEGSALKPTIKKIIYLGILCVFFTYGLLAGLYNKFPVPQILTAKHYIEQSFGDFETHYEPVSLEAGEIRETFLQRLFIKKIPLEGFSGHGGGISVSGKFIIIVTNKGSVNVYDLDSYSIVNSDITEVPMNFYEFIQSGHMYHNDFYIPWFRVNGTYLENVDSQTSVLYASHNAYDSANDCITHNISRVEISVNDQKATQKSDWTTIFTASPCINPVPEKYVASRPYSGHISGGAIANYDDQHLLVSIGDYNHHGINGIAEYAMDDSNPYGKFLLMDKESGEWTIFSTGHRNPSGLYIDKEQNIWSVENGPSGGDELNLIQKGANYGWPKVSYGVWYDSDLTLPGNQPMGSHSEYSKPFFTWVPSIAPSSIIRIEENKFNLWQGDLLVGTMRDQSLHRIRPDGNNRVIYDERIELGHRIRDITSLPDDKLAIITDDSYLIIIEDGGPISDEVTPEAKERLAELAKFNRFTADNEQLVEKASIQNTSGKQIFQHNCAVCHNLKPTNQVGPHLSNLLDREVGSVANFNYSQTLTESTKKWDTQLLKSFLTNPGDKFAGTQMQKINLTSSEIDSIVKFLKEQRN